MRKFFLCILVLFFFGCSGQGKRAQTETTEPVAPVNDLPELMVTMEDGSSRTTKDLKGKVALILFQPDCDHCQREAVDIKRHIDSFKDFNIFFIAAAPMKEVLQFANDYKLKEYPNVHWGTTTVQNILSTFGPIDAPSVYLYSSDGKLIESFNGEIAVETIVKYL